MGKKKANYNQKLNSSIQSVDSRMSQGIGDLKYSGYLIEQFERFDDNYFSDEMKMREIFDDFLNDCKQYNLIDFVYCTSDNLTFSKLVKEKLEFIDKYTKELDGQIKSQNLVATKLLERTKKKKLDENQNLKEEEFKYFEEIQKQFHQTSSNADRNTIIRFNDWCRSFKNFESKNIIPWYRNKINSMIMQIKQELKISKKMALRAAECQDEHQNAQITIGRILTQLGITKSDCSSLDLKKMMEPVRELHRTQLDVAFQLNAMNLKRLIRPFHVALYLIEAQLIFEQCEENKLSKNGRSVTDHTVDEYFDGMSNTILRIKTLMGSNFSKVEEISEIVASLELLDEAMERMNVIFQWFTWTSQIKGMVLPCQLMDNGSYLCMKNSTSLALEWTKREFCLVMGKKLVASNRKMNNFKKLSDDLSKTSVRYPDGFKSTLCVDLFFVKGFVKIKFDNVAETRKFVANIRKMTMQADKIEEIEKKDIHDTEMIQNSDHNESSKKQTFLLDILRQDLQKVHTKANAKNVSDSSRIGMKSSFSSTSLIKLYQSQIDINSISISNSSQEIIMDSSIGNDSCADCKDRTSNVSEIQDANWISVNQGVCICLRCSGKHRALTVKYSKVKSIIMDKLHACLVRMMYALGNNLCNIIMEYQIQYSDEKKYAKQFFESENFIEMKYEKSSFMPETKHEWSRCAKEFRKVLHQQKRDILQNECLENLTTNAIKLDFSKLVDEVICCDNLPAFYFLYKYSHKDNMMEKCMRNAANLELALKNHSNMVFVFLLYNDIHPTIDDNGNTILHRAALIQNRPIYDFLLSIEMIDKNALNKDGKTAHELIRK